MQYPDLSRFPDVDDTIVDLPIMSPAMARMWRESTFVDYGTDSCIRCTHNGLYHIVKFAHPNKAARARLQYEFYILGKIAQSSIPTPKFNPEPLIDEGGLYAYRMEGLDKFSAPELKYHSKDIESLLDRIHEQGFSHGDLTPSNIMRNEEGRAVLIDFSLSGFIGTSIPDHIPPWVYQSDVFHERLDRERFERFFM